VAKRKEGDERDRAKPESRPPAFITVPPRRVLFLCVHNSARSQIAEGLARHLAPPGVEIWSAGSKPGTVDPRAIQVMQEIGIDIGAQRSKPLDQVPWRDADTVVTVCGERDEVCPAVASGVRRVHWPLPDPTQAPQDQALGAFRDTRDELKWRIASLWPQGD
jgi:arsenate reductase